MAKMCLHLQMRMLPIFGTFDNVIIMKRKILDAEIERFINNDT